MTTERNHRGLGDAELSGANRWLNAALRLHRHLAAHHVHNTRLEGPDQGVRWNIRVWRFWKSAFPTLARDPRHFFLQGQGYWALANWSLSDLTGDPRFRDHAGAAAAAVRAAQRPDGSWAYPLRERRHLVATVEGNFGAVTMLEMHRRGHGEAWTAAACRWYDFVETHIGYQEHPAGGLAVNYFDQPRGMVPNNAAEWIWVLGRLHAACGDDRFLEPVPRLLQFLESAQRPTGELPYELGGVHDPRTREHYLCYQYNAFQCMKLAWFAEATDDVRARGLATRLADYLVGGVLPSGAVRASCGSTLPEVVYYADAVGLALETVTSLGWRDYYDEADRTFEFVLGRQRADGSFPFSRGDYNVLSDRGPYPRYLAMTLFHLTERARRGS